MSVTAQRVGAARRLDKDLRPNEAGLDMNRCHFGNTDADLILAEPGTLAPYYRLVRYFNVSWKQEVSPGQAARAKDFGWHISAKTISLRRGGRQVSGAKESGEQNVTLASENRHWQMSGSSHGI